MRNIAMIIWLFSVVIIMALLAMGANHYGTQFSLGLLAGTVLTQLAVKARYGEWF